MTEFETSGSVVIELDERSLRDAEEEIETRLGDVTVSASAARTDGGGGRGRRRARVIAQAAEAQAEELPEQTQLLEDIFETLDDGVGGGGGGGGGGLLGGGGSGFLAGSLAGGGLSGLSGALTGGTAALAGQVGLGALLGIGGVRGLQEVGVTDAVRGAGEFARGLPGGEIAGDAAQFTPGTSLGTAALDIAQGDLSFSRTVSLQARRIDIASGVIDGFVSGGSADTSEPNDISRFVRGDSGPDSVQSSVAGVLELAGVNPTASEGFNRFAASQAAQPSLNALGLSVPEGGFERPDSAGPNVNADVTIEQRGGLDQAVQRALDELRNNILRQVADEQTTGSVSNTQQDNFQRRLR